MPFQFIGDVGPREDAEEEGPRALRARPDEQLVDRLKRLHPNVKIAIANDQVEQLRGTKSAAELALIRQAVDITVRAQKEAIAAVKAGMNEFEIQALIEYTFRRNGADRPSFSTIVGSGPNSTTLHYNADDRFIGPNDLIVMDIGASYKGYAADVTRTVPASGHFSTSQRDIYQIVREAQASAERQLKTRHAGAHDERFGQRRARERSRAAQAHRLTVGHLRLQHRRARRGSARSIACTTCMGWDMASASRCTIRISTTTRRSSGRAACSPSSRASTCASMCWRRCRTRRATGRSPRGCDRR